MDQTSRAQVRLILDHLVIDAKKSVDARVKAIYAKYAAKHLLQSGATIKAVVSAVEEIAAEFITRCVDQVSSVGKDTEAFSMIQEAVEGFSRFLASKVDNAAERASGVTLDNRILEAARSRYGASQNHLERQLEIHRFTFTVPPALNLDSEVRRPAKKTSGGRPLAPHWDDMWAAIAVLLYAGDLQPKTQADIERAMKEWLVENDFDVGDTAVRDRARKLWQKLERAE